MNIEHFRPETVAEGVLAAIALPDRGAVGNAGVVDLGGATLVFDTHFSPAAARRLREAAERIAPVEWVVNSHWHADHVRGNASMPGEAPVAATERTRELIAELGVPALEQVRSEGPAEIGAEIERLRAAGDTAQAEAYEELLADLPALEQRLPDETFEERRFFEGEARSAELLTFGGGHTDSDAVLLLPDEGVLFAADLVVLDTHPWIGHGHPEAWLGILDRLDGLEARTIVPGHGPVAGAGATVFVRDYLETVLELPEELPDRFRSLANPAGWERNVAFLRERR